MAFTLFIREVNSISENSDDAATSCWRVELDTGSESLTTELRDPFDTFPWTRSEQDLTWYLESHINEPFDTSRADSAAESLLSYGRDLASQLFSSKLLPKHGDIYLNIVSKGGKSVLGGRSLQQLHWEVLENPTVWPSSVRYTNIAVVRSISVGNNTHEPSTLSNRTNFRILLVVSRPRPGTDVEYQLVAKSLVANAKHASKTNQDFNVSLTVLRPPTWPAFRERLRLDARYDLVHFDMKGLIKTADNGSTSPVLEFSKVDLGNPFKMKRDLRTADEVGQELARARVATVVLNACNSASFRGSAPGSNLAEVLLSHGVQSVAAMAYKVTEEAVEIFMGAFYQTLLARATPVQDAVRVARAALLQNQSRRALYMHNVYLSDYIVPVLYTTVLDFSIQTKFNTGKSFASQAQSILDSIKQLSWVGWTTTSTKPADSKPLTLLGRDYNILSLEALLCVSPLVFMYGQGGCGKTELLRYASGWWKSSGWITDAAYIDFSILDISSMNDVVGQIGKQLGICGSDSFECTDQEVLERLEHGKYMLIFDSAEAFGSPVLLDKIVASGELPSQLASFIAAATRAGCSVIVSSRLDSTTIAHIPSDHIKYRLSGLSVLDSITLLQSLCFNPRENVPEVFCRRENIDFLRRAAILLEGNPAALQLVVPELQKVQYNAEALLNTLLYGVCKTHLDDENVMENCRFVRTLYSALVLPSFIDFDATHIHATQFSPFWTVMPKDLTNYYWFLYLSSSKYFQEGSYATWLTQRFRDYVDNGHMARKLRTHWPNIESKLIKAGILTHATITRLNGRKVECYHVHPLYTLIARGAMKEEGWREARFAFVRQAVIWDPAWTVKLGQAGSEDSGDDMDWARIEWDGVPGPQHDDHLYNWRTVAMGWAVQDGNPLEELDRMGITMTDVTYMLVVRSIFGHMRVGKLMIPHFRAYLLQAHMITDLLRPGKVPTNADLGAILGYSWVLYKLEPDEAGQSAKWTLVTTALEVASRWQAANPSSPLPIDAEVKWFQLRHAEAALAEEFFGLVNDGLSKAKALYERNLSTDPATPLPGMRNIIRRWHLESLNGWAACVGRLAVREGRLSKSNWKSGIQQINDTLGPPGKHGEGMGNLLRRPLEFFKENAGMAEKFTVREQLSFAVEQEPEVVAKFGSFVTSILDRPMLDVFEDMLPQFSRLAGEQSQYSDGQGHKATTTEQVLAVMARLMENKDLPEAQGIRALQNTMEWSMRFVAGDNAGAAQVLQQDMAREALSSTSSSGWEKLADMHLQMHALATWQTETPDYKRGLRHMEEWWKLHHGVGISRNELAHGHLKFAKCYHHLGRVADTAKSTIKIIEAAQTFEPSDCIDGDVIGGKEWFYLQIAKLNTLEAFLDPRVVFSGAPGVAELGLRERVMMYQIITQGKKIEMDRKAGRDSLLKSVAEMKRLRETLRGLQGLVGDKELDSDRDKRLDELIEEIEQPVLEVKKDLDFFLF